MRATITELPANVYAATTNTYQVASPNNIIHSDIAFNRLIGWNHSYDFSVTPGSNYYHADSRKVATHELGHSEGLGHTGINPAIMRQGATTYWWAQWNDQQGIVAIYGAYP